MTGQPTHPRVFRALKELAREREVCLRVRGTSMQPWLEDGARVLIRSSRLYWPGDVIALRSRDGDLIIHRILGFRPSRDGLRVVAKGDAAANPDASVAYDQVVGRLMGGNCPRRLLKVPMADRIKSLRQFAGLVMRYFWP